MVESITEYNDRTEELRPEIKKTSLTKTIRFNKKESDLWDIWDATLVKKIKVFIREQFTYQQAIRSHLSKSDNPISEKKRLMTDRMELIKFLQKKKASSEKIDQLCQEYNDIYNTKL